MARKRQSQPSTKNSSKRNNNIITPTNDVTDKEIKLKSK
jgi:hypothetical protein